MTIERNKHIWAFKRTHLLGGRLGFISVPASVANMAIERKFASATFNGKQPDRANAPFADEDPRDPPEVIVPLARLADGKLGVVRDATTGEAGADVPAKRKPGRPRKNPAP